MEQPIVEVQDPPANTPSSIKSAVRIADSVGRGTTVAPQACPTCGTVPAANGATVSAPSWVYVLGHIEARFPSISVEKEFAQATGRERTSGLTDRQALHSVLSKRVNRYLLRQLCFVMMVAGLET